jgi:hypothetical protein
MGPLRACPDLEALISGGTARGLKLHEADIHYAQDG